MGARVVVATTKFVVPKIADGVIARPKLIEQLNGSLGSRMVLVAAPPGSGKTTLLAEWVRQLTCPVAWLSCDATDADGRRFWRSMTMGLRRTWPTVGLDADEFLDDGNHRDLAISLANDLGEVEQPGVVVLDDFHLADPDAAAMSAFIRSLPHSTTLVIGTRSDPPFALGRLRVQGQLRELRQHDLRLEQEEVDRFFDHDGVDLSPEELAQLAELHRGLDRGSGPRPPLPPEQGLGRRSAAGPRRHRPQHGGFPRQRGPRRPAGRHRRVPAHDGRARDVRRRAVRCRQKPAATVPSC